MQMNFYTRISTKCVGTNAELFTQQQCTNTGSIPKIEKNIISVILLNHNSFSQSVDIRAYFCRNIYRNQTDSIGLLRILDFGKIGSKSSRYSNIGRNTFEFAVIGFGISN